MLEVEATLKEKGVYKKKEGARNIDSEAYGFKGFGTAVLRNRTQVSKSLARIPMCSGLTCCRI